MNHGLCGLSVPRRNTSNDLLAEMSDGLLLVVSWTCSMGRREGGRRLSAMKNVYFIVSRYLVLTAAP